jgi:thymidylate synthase
VAKNYTNMTNEGIRHDTLGEFIAMEMSLTVKELVYQTMKNHNYKKQPDYLNRQLSHKTLSKIRWGKDRDIKLK